MTGAVRKPVDTSAGSLMVLLCAVWGCSHVVTKLAAPDVSLLMQAALRSSLATVLLFLWTRVRRVPLFDGDGTLWPGIVAGLLFAGEFLFIFAGLAHTTASRMVVFVYLSPILTAVGIHVFVPGERLNGVQWLGVLLAFAGIGTAFGEGFAAASSSLLGDAFGVLAAVFWAATTVWIRATRLTRTGAEKVLFYQLAVSAGVLLVASPLAGEPGVVRWSTTAIAALVFQGGVVAFATYLAWFWLLTRYRAANLSVFGFLTPLFGVAAGVIVLGDPLTPAFLAAIALVGAGIALVMRKA